MAHHPFSTFSDIAPITPLSSHSYTAALKDTWSIGTVPNGGYVTSLFLLVARQHMGINHPSRPQPHPITLHLEFLRRTSAGDAVFTVRDLKLGVRATNLHLTLSQRDSEASRVNVEGYVTMSNLRTEQGLSLPTSFVLHPPRPAQPDFSALLAHGGDENWTVQPAGLSFPEFRKAANHVRVYLPRLRPRPRGEVLHSSGRGVTGEGKAKAKSHVDQWVRFHPEARRGRWTNDALGFVVDIFPPIVEEYLDGVEKEERAGKEKNLVEPRSATETERPEPKTARFWYPTLALNLDVKKALPEGRGKGAGGRGAAGEEEEGVEWLFVRVGAKVIRNGRMDLEVLVLDELGEVVAISTHVGLIMGTERNVAGRGGGGGGGGGKTEEREGKSKL